MYLQVNHNETNANVNRTIDGGLKTQLFFLLSYFQSSSWLFIVKLGSDLGWYDREGLTPYDLIRLDAPFQIAKGGGCFFIIMIIIIIGSLKINQK